MAIYEPPDDAAYLAWLDANPNGYVINAEPGGGGYVLLHRATCTHMRSHPPFIGPTYIKVCSDSPVRTRPVGAPVPQGRGCPALQGSRYELLAALSPRLG